MRHRYRVWVSAVGLLSIAAATPLPAMGAVRTNYTVVNTTQHSTIDGSNVAVRVKEEHDDDSGLAPQARAAVVMDAATGKVLLEKDGHEKLPMASITKIMTMLLIMESLDSGKLKWTDKIKTSEYAASMGGSQIFLQPGEIMTVEEMMKGIAMASANDACVAMAEHLSGSQEAFVKWMNKRAHQLGMEDTHFVNCNGLPAPDHYSSAHDIALMSRELLKHEVIVKYTSVYSDYLRKNTDHPFWLVNTNKLVRFYDGVDGLKTGFTQEAKYCLSATAKRGNFRVITVVMGEPKPTIRNQEVSELLNWAFASYTSKVMYKAGDLVKEVEFRRGRPEVLKVAASDTVGVVEQKGQVHEYTVETRVDEELSLPIKKGQTVGKLVVLKKGQEVASTDLVAVNSVHKLGFFNGIGRAFKEIVTFGS